MSGILLRNLKKEERKVNYAIAPLIAASLLAGGTSLLSGGLNYLGTKAQNKSNIQLMREQNQWNLEQWNRENEYNLPANQMARLEAAGLNKNLIYGNGSHNLQAASSPRFSHSVTCP